jgi:ABC-type lipoprotein release transport system permease subunit
MVRLLMGSGLRMIAVGGAVGMVLAVVAAMLLRGLLYGVQPLDPVAFGLVPLVLAAVGILSTWIPARRASMVSPVKALKSD